MNNNRNAIIIIVSCLHWCNNGLEILLHDVMYVATGTGVSVLDLYSHAAYEIVAAINAQHLRVIFSKPSLVQIRSLNIPITSTRLHLPSDYKFIIQSFEKSAYYQKFYILRDKILKAELLLDRSHCSSSLLNLAPFVRKYL